MMTSEKTLQRFINAQQSDYQIAFSEIKQGKKQGHWMWYIFPQIQGLGFSDTSRFYAIRDMQEAEEYLDHPILGVRIVLISNELLKLEETDAVKIFGNPDYLKLKSSMTLFAMVANTHTVFQSVLDKFFGGEQDEKTLKIISHL